MSVFPGAERANIAWPAERNSEFTNSSELGKCCFLPAVLVAASWRLFAGGIRGNYPVQAGGAARCSTSRLFCSLHRAALLSLWWGQRASATSHCFCLCFWLMVKVFIQQAITSAEWREKPITRAVPAAAGLHCDSLTRPFLGKWNNILYIIYLSIWTRETLCAALVVIMLVLV